MRDALHVSRDRVRDYECDLQGIVNNANYLHYLEHARHEFLLSRNVSFADLHHRGIDAVVARVAMALKVSLRPGDEYECQLKVEKEGVKYQFRQEIWRVSDMKLCVSATITTVCLIDGRLGTHEELDGLVAPPYPPPKGGG